MNDRPHVALVDSGFWYAVLTEKDEHHRDARSKEEQLLSLRYILPWPTLYETLRTRLTRRPLAVVKFQDYLKHPNAELLDDSLYKSLALEITLSAANRRGRGFSLVDNVLRLILDDVNIKVDCLFTYNVADFFDVCRRRRVEIV